MGSGLRAEVWIDAPEACPVARAAGNAGTTAGPVSKGVAGGTVTEEFVLDAEIDGIELGDGGMTEVFAYGSKHVYRFSRAGGRGCPCERIEGFGCPVVDARAHDGALCLTFHAPDAEHLREAVADLRGAYAGVEVRRLLRSDGPDAGGDLVVVDRGSLTDRQREVLETAHAMGYFDHPKGANAGEVAAALDITASTLAEHLAAAQRKLVSPILDGGR